MQLPKFSSYGDYTSDNYGAHTLRFDIGPVSIWYSYKTVVAFRVKELRVLNYTDSRTTMKHLKMIDGGDRGNRLELKEFQRLWDKEVGPTLERLS